MSLHVQMNDFDELEPNEQECSSQNGAGREYANYLRVLHNGKTLFLLSDAMEPEDARFTRDLSWVKNVIECAYALGHSDASSAEAHPGSQP